MNQNNNDLTRGFKEYESKVKNIKGMLKKVESLFDVSEYTNELKGIKMEVKENSDLKNIMISESFTLEYQAMVLAPYIKKLDDLENKIENDLLPFYELYLLSEKINFEIEEINAEKIGDVIQYTKKLIDDLNSLNTHNDKEKNKIVKDAYKSIYSVILYEELFKTSDILSYINYLDIPTNKENIGELLQHDLKLLSKKDLIDEDLQTLKKEGLGYDYLTQDIIKKISILTIGNSNSEYLSRKEKEISDISNQKDRLDSNISFLTHELAKNKYAIKNLSINMTVLATKALSLILVPLISIGAGNAIGKKISNNITEYKTITRTVNFETGEIIGDPEEIYDKNETTYVATVMVHKPWRKNPTGVGYIQEITAYEYIAPDTTQEKYHITAEDLENNIKEKYSYVETKDMLKDGDNTNDTTILITETFQDKNDNRKSTKFIIPFTVTGVALGILIDALLLAFLYDPYRLRRNFSEIINDIENYKLDNKEIINKLNAMKEEAILLEDKYQSTLKKYGTWEEKFDIEDSNKKAEKIHIKTFKH